MTMSRPHFLLKVENDCVPKSFWTNETIKEKIKISQVLLFPAEYTGTFHLTPMSHYLLALHLIVETHEMMGGGQASKLNDFQHTTLKWCLKHDTDELPTQEFVPL